MALKLQLFCRKIAKITQRLGAVPPGPFRGTLKLHRFVQLGAQIRQFCAKTTKLLVQASYQQNPGCASGRVHSCRQIFQTISWAADEKS